MSKKFGVCLGSGGSRGVAHVGVLRALEEANIKIDYITGCSMGSVVGACYAKGYSPDEMMRIAHTLKAGDIFDLPVNFIRNMGILRSTKMHALVTDLLGDTTFDELKIPFACVASDMVSGKCVLLNKGKVADAVIASSSIPFIFAPYKIDDMLLVDGGLLNRTPIKELREMGAEAVLTIDVLGELKRQPEIKQIFELIFRTMDVIDWNNCTKKYKKDKGDLLLMPDLGTMSQYKVKLLDFAHDKGYELIKDNMDKIKEIVEGQ